MCRGLARTLLWLSLLAVTGQAAAAPCASEMFLDLPIQSETGSGHRGHCSAQAGAHHCDKDDSLARSDCEQDCKCCPGHCAGAVPASDNKDSLPARNSQTSNYSEIDSSPLPETTLRPPISR